MARCSEFVCGPDDEALGRAVDAAARTLAAGGIVAHPTFAVYGLGGAATPAVDSVILGLKGRGSDRPLLRLVLESSEVERLYPSVRWTDVAERLAADFWPGGLTLVLDDGTAGGLAVRAEAHPVVRRLLERWGHAMSSTSLNRPGAEPAASAGQARSALEAIPAVDRKVLFLNAGRLPGPPASTLLSLRGGEVRLLREGAVPVVSLEVCLGRQVAR